MANFGKEILKKSGAKFRTVKKKESLDYCENDRSNMTKEYEVQKKKKKVPEKHVNHIQNEHVNQFSQP